MIAQIHALARRMAALPPVDLCEIGDACFVCDGDHHVSVVRQIGQQEIDAYVMELSVDIPLEPDDPVGDLLLNKEHSDFLEWAELHLLRPDRHIEFSEPGISRSGTAHQRTSLWIWNSNAKSHERRRLSIGATRCTCRWCASLEKIGSEPGPEQATRHYLDYYPGTHPPDALHTIVHYLRTNEFC
ncbi:MAG: hypothetical protein ACUVSY_16290 [Roseiflexus sp.]